MLNTSLKCKTHNYFTFELKDAVTGKVKQTAKAENVVCNAFYTTNRLGFGLRGVRLGTGTGTPAASDTSLFTQKYMLETTGSPVVTEYSNNTLLVTLSATSPLGNTGVFTEVGLGRSGWSLLTHALITDSEGEPITVTQTDTDILSITAYVYFTLTAYDSLQTYNVKSVKYLVQAFNATNTTDSDTYYFMRPDRVYVGLADCISNFAESNVDSLLMNTTVGGSSISGAVTRIGVDTGNIGYYNFAYIAPTFGYNGTRNYPIGYVKFPNSTVFPPYTVTGLSVGTGDGTTTQFKAPLDLFIANSDTIKVNGVAKTRGTDYTINNNTNNNKRICISAGNLAKYVPTYTGTAISYTSWFATGNAANINMYISTDMPMILNLSSLDDKRVNYIVLPPLCYDTGIGGNYSWNGTIRVSYSTDNSTYTTVADIVYTNGLPQSTISLNNAIEANYWRIEVLTSTSYASCFPNGNYNTAITNAYANRFFGYTEEYAITFTTPPADGAVITMDCQLDRPYKSSNYAIDLQGSITVTN